MTACRNCTLRKISTFRAFTDAELSFMGTFKSGELAVEPGPTILLEGMNSAHVFMMLSGWAIRFKTLESTSHSHSSISPMLWVLDCSHE